MNTKVLFITMLLAFFIWNEISFAQTKIPTNRTGLEASSNGGFRITKKAKTEPTRLRHLDIRDRASGPDCYTSPGSHFSISNTGAVGIKPEKMEDQTDNVTKVRSIKFDDPIRSVDLSLPVEVTYSGDSKNITVVEFDQYKKPSTYFSLVKTSTGCKAAEIYDYQTKEVLYDEKLCTGAMNEFKKNQDKCSKAEAALESVLKNSLDRLQKQFDSYGVKDWSIDLGEYSSSYNELALNVGAFCKVWDKKARDLVAKVENQEKPAKIQQIPYLNQ